MLWLLINLGALAGVLIAIRVGVARDRMWHAADFLFVGSAAAIYVEAAFHLAKRRGRRQRDREVPYGIRLQRPGWMRMGELASLLGPGATVAAALSGAGFLGVGVGVFLSSTAVFVGMELAPFGVTEGLTFELEGLRFHLRGTTFLVPWGVITKVERGGSESHRLIYLGVGDIRPVLGSVEPDLPRMRFRARVILGDREPPSGRITLTPWTGGLDGPVLARAINAAVDSRRARSN